MRTRWFVPAGLAVALLLAGLVSIYASSSPDGLTKGSEDHGFSDTDGNFYFWSSALAPPAGKFAINFGRMIDPEIDAALNLQRGSVDPAVRQKASQDLNRIMGSKAENVWLTWVTWANIARTNVRGLDQFKLEDGKAPTPNFFPGYLNLHNAYKA